MATAWVRLVAIGSWLIAGAATVFAAGRNEVLSTPELLLDLARDHGLDCRGTQTPADVRQIQTLLRAATRLDPRVTAAYVWLHELAVLRGEPQDAAEALRRLIAVDPAYEGAQLRWLEVALEQNPTVEKRTEWLQAQLAANAGRPKMQAMIHVHLGRLALLGLDRPRAQEHVNQALTLDPWNPEAAALHLELLSAESPPETRLRAALKFLSLCPLHVETAWRIGSLLDQHGFDEDAATFFDHALEVHRLANPGAPVPGAYLLQWAYHALARGQSDAAAQRATEAIAADPAAAAEAGMFLHWLRTRQGRTADADAIREQLSRRFAALREPGEWLVNEVAQAAWFYCTIDKQPQRALMLAEAAAARAPADAFVTRVLGWAQAANIQAEQAQRTLLPIAGHDPYAAYQVAKLLKDAGEEAAAKRVLGALTLRPHVGPAQELLSRLGWDEAATQPAAERYPRLAAALAEFDRDVLAFHREPGRFLQVAVSPEDRTPNPGEPWWMEFTLANRARFPITLGPDLLVNPVFLLSFELEGDRRREFPNLLTISLDRTRVIPPGQTVQARYTVDLGPLRRASRLTPQHVQRVVVRAILDPVCGPDGRWRPGVTGQSLGPVYFNRLPAGTSREALHALFSALNGLAELLSEAQRARLGRLSYKPEAVPLGPMQQSLLAGLNSDSWELRARTLDALQVAGFDAPALQAVESCLDHPHWLVRLMAVRLLASRQGAAAKTRLEPIVRGDPDDLVREMASSCLAALEAPPLATQPAQGTTQPTTSSAPSPSGGADD
jgi:hypothetical protein